MNDFGFEYNGQRYEFNVGVGRTPNSLYNQTADMYCFNDEFGAYTDLTTHTKFEIYFTNERERRPVIRVAELRWLRL